MENRFGFKDFVIVVLLVAALVMIGLAMVQYNRQWGQIEQVNQHLEQQGKQLRKITDLLGHGVPLDRGAASATQTTTAPAQSNFAFPRVAAAATQPGYANGGWLILRFGANIAKLTPLVVNESYTSTIQENVLQSLAQRDPNTFKWKPLIAQSWTVSKDGLTMTFNLRHDVTFSDGEPCTAADVVYTFNLIMDPHTPDPWLKPYYKRFKSVKANGKWQVTFTLSDPYFQGFENAAGMQILPKHFYSQFTPKQFSTLPGLLMGTGPYMLQEGPKNWKPGSDEIVLVRNPNYWAASPAFDRIVYRIITDPTAALTTFFNGDLDVFGPNPQQYARLKDSAKVTKVANVHQYWTVTGGYNYIGWNEQRDGKPTRFANPLVRRAMTMLLDRQRMASRIMAGLAKVTTGPFNPLSPQYDHSIKPWPYDPAQAKALLKQAGYYDRDGDKIIDGPDGKPFEFKLMYPASSNTAEELAMACKDALAQAGIVMTPDPTEWTIMQQRLNARQFDASMVGWTGGIEGDPYQIFDSASIANGGNNSVHYVDKKLDQIIETARRTMDESKRMAMWHQVHRIIHEDQPYTFLFVTKSNAWVNKRIHNVHVTKVGLNDQNQWFMPAAQQTRGN